MDSVLAVVGALVIAAFTVVAFVILITALGGILAFLGAVLSAVFSLS